VESIWMGENENFRPRKGLTVKVMAFLLLIFVVVCIFLLFSREGGIAVEEVSSASIYFLTRDQIKELSIEAKEGNKDSAFKLSLYYCFSEYDKVKYLYWLEISARNGHPTAQYNMAVMMQEEKRASDAMYWAEMAKKNGVAKSDDLINEIKQGYGKNERPQSR